MVLCHSKLFGGIAHFFQLSVVACVLFSSTYHDLRSLAATYAENLRWDEVLHVHVGAPLPPDQRLMPA